MGACMLVRRAAIDEVGPLDEGFFLFSEETDWCYRFAQAGWKILFTPAAECVHVGGASHGGRLFRENVRGHLRFFWKHRGPAEAERVRRLLRASLLLRGALYRSERGAHLPRDGPVARVGRRARVDRAMSSLLLFARLAFATGVVLAPGAILARALGVRGTSRHARLGARSRLRRDGPDVPRAGLAHPHARLAARRRRSGGGARAAPLGRPGPARALAGVARRHRARGAAVACRRRDRRRRPLPPRSRAQAARVRRPLALGAERVRRRWAASRVRVPALARVPRARGEARARRPGQGGVARGVAPRAARRARRLRGRLRPVPARRAGRGGCSGGSRPRRDGARPRRCLHRARASRDRLPSDPRAGRARARARGDASPDARTARDRCGSLARARGRAPDLRALPPHPLRRLPRGALGVEAGRDPGRCAGARGPGAAGSGVLRVAPARRAEHGLGQPRRDRACTGARAVRRPAARPLGRQLLARARGVRPCRRRRRRRPAARPARRVRGEATLGRLRRRRLARGVRDHARALAVHAVLRRRLPVAGPPSRRLSSLRVRVRRRHVGPGRAGGALHGAVCACRRPRLPVALPGRLRVPARRRRPRLGDVGRGGRGAPGARRRLSARAGPRADGSAGLHVVPPARVRPRAARLVALARPAPEPSHSGPRRDAAQPRAGGGRRLRRSRVELPHRGVRARVRLQRAAQPCRRHEGEPAVRAPRRRAAVLPHRRPHGSACVRRALARARP